VRQRYSFVVVGYVVTPEHFHLLISEPQDESPSTVIQAVKLGFVQRLPVGRSGGVDKSPTSRTEREKWGTPESPEIPEAPVSSGIRRYIWQRRFYDFNVWTEHKRIGKLRYMHCNRVRREGWWKDRSSGGGAVSGRMPTGRPEWFASTSGMC